MNTGPTTFIFATREITKTWLRYKVESNNYDETWGSLLSGPSVSISQQFAGGVGFRSPHPVVCDFLRRSFLSPCFLNSSSSLSVLILLLLPWGEPMASGWDFCFEGIVNWMTEWHWKPEFCVCVCVFVCSCFEYNFIFVLVTYRYQWHQIMSKNRDMLVELWSQIGIWFRGRKWEIKMNRSLLAD